MQLEGENLKTYHLRESHKRNWVRLHSLPQSIRYPYNNDDNAIILKRHNTVLSRVFSNREIVSLILTTYTGLDEDPISQELIETYNCFKWRTEYYEEDGYSVSGEWDFWKANIAWESGVIDPVILRAAEDEITNAFLTNKDTSSIYHPYDGGMDLFFDNIALKATIKKEFLDWYPQKTKGY
jgi:hypothetical protein